MAMKKIIKKDRHMVPEERGNNVPVIMNLMPISGYGATNQSNWSVLPFFISISS